MKLMMSLWQECATCQMPLHDHDGECIGTELNYKVCPRCFKKVDEETEKNKNYRARWRRYVKKLSKWI